MNYVVLQQLHAYALHLFARYKWLLSLMTKDIRDEIYRKILVARLSPLKLGIERSKQRRKKEEEVAMQI